MNRRRKLLGALAVMATATLIGACGSSAPTDAGGGVANTTPAHRKALQFVACMRHHGVSDFPDPPASGQLTIDAVANGSSVDTSTPTFSQAISACRTLEPSGFTGRKPTAQQANARLKFAQCMRTSGVPDFPDPAPNGPLIDTTRIPSLAGKDPRTDPALNGAMDKCRTFSAAAGVVGP